MLLFKEYVIFYIDYLIYFMVHQVLGEVDLFEEAVRLVIKDVSFDTDVVVSVFETNIRMLG